MAENLRLRVVLDMAERVLAPLKRISAASGDTARALRAAKDRLKELNDQQAAVGNVQKQQAEFARLNNTLKIKQSLLAGMRAGGAATAAQLKREESGVRSLSDALEKQRGVALKARAALSAMGVTGSLSTAQARLRAEIDNATGAMTKQRAELQRLAKQQQHLQALRDKHGKAMLHTGMAAGTGLAMQAAGRRGVEIGMAPVANYAKHEDAMLGIARQVPGARSEMGKLTEVYRQAERDVRSLSGQVPLATTEIAAMMTAAARMEVPTNELKEFTLMASEIATAFDAVPDEITESMGKVAKNFKIPITEIRGLADSINYLDDNAISKGADIINFLNRTSGVVSTVAMSARDSAALGSTLLTLGERPEAASTAANAIVQKFAAATKGTKKFKSAMAEIGMTTKAVQDGMSTDAMGTLNQVIDAVGRLPKSQRIGVMVELVGLEHSDTLAKLVDKPEELARQRKLANGSEAQGSMGREAATRNAALSAQWQMTKNRAFNLSAVVGESLAPALLSLMKVVTPLLEGFTRWVQENPVLVGWIMKLAIGAAALVAVLGAVLLPLALIAGKALLVRFLFARLTTSLFGMRAAAAGTGPAMGLLSRLAGVAARVFAFVRPAIMGAGRAILWLGRLLLASPLGRAISLLGFSAKMVYDNWDGITGGLAAIWMGITDRVSEAMRGGIGKWSALLADWSPIGILYSVIAFGLDALGIELPARFSGLGSTLMAGLGRGISSGFNRIVGGLVGIWQSITARVSQAVQGGIGTWSALLISWSPLGLMYSAITFALDSLGIDLPARFKALGGNLISGLVNGITSGLSWLKTTVVGMATSVGSWFADPLGINSPSRVFMQYGGWVSEGAALGMTGGQAAVRNAALGIATAATMAMPMAANASALQLDARPSLGAPAAGAPAGGGGGNTYTITINPAPGVDAQGIARAVAAELDRRERSRQSSRLSALHDID